MSRIDYKHWRHSARWAPYTAYAVLAGQLAGNVPPSPPPEDLPPAIYRQVSIWHALAPARAAAEAYWLPNRLAGIVPPDLVETIGVCSIDLPIIPPRRAAPAAYDIALRPPPPEAVEALPEAANRQLLPERAPGPKRAAAEAYWINTSAAQNILTGQVTPPPAALGRLLPDRAPGPLRAAQQAYWIENRLAGNVPPPPVEALPTASYRTILPDRAPAAQRAAPEAYWLPNRLAGNVPPPVVEDLPPAAYRSVLPKHAPGARRTAASAYWINNRLAGIVPPTPPEALPSAAYRELLPERAPAARRAADQAYWIDTSFLQNILTGRVEPPDATWKVLLPDRAPGALRAGAGAYWIDNRLATPALVPAEDLPSGQRVLLPARPRAAERAAAGAYWIGNRFQIADAPFVDTRGRIKLSSEAPTVLQSDEGPGPLLADE